MLESFIEWLLYDMWDSIRAVIKEVVAWLFIIFTAPVWIVPFLFWYFFEWRNKPEVESEPVVEVAHGSSHVAEPERESILNTFLQGSYE